MKPIEKNTKNWRKWRKITKEHKRKTLPNRNPFIIREQWSTKTTRWKTRRTLCRNKEKSMKNKEKWRNLIRTNSLTQKTNWKNTQKSRKIQCKTKENKRNTLPNRNPKKIPQTLKKNPQTILYPFRKDKKQRWRFLWTTVADDQETSWYILVGCKGKNETTARSLQRELPSTAACSRSALSEARKDWMYLNVKQWP